MSNELPGGSVQETEELLDVLWQQAQKEIQTINPMEENWKIQTLPLARIKKIMKTEEFIMQELEKDKMKSAAAAGESSHEDSAKPAIKFMIAGEAPVVVSRACELLIRELTCRAWQHTERNRRRTLQRQDIHAAVGESDVYDFLIDIVPRVTSSTSRSMPPQAGPDPTMHHNVAMGAHGIPQQHMDQNAHLMGQALAAGAEMFSDPQQQMQYLMQLQQQQAAAAAAVAASAMDPSDQLQQQQHHHQQQRATQGWTDHQHTT